jgi:hypothetical protein
MQFKSDEPCVSCRCTPPNTLHHLVSRGAGGSNHPSNILSSCTNCHALVHSMGLLWLSVRAPAVRYWLVDHGWVLDGGIKQGKWLCPPEARKALKGVAKFTEG